MADAEQKAQVTRINVEQEILSQSLQYLDLNGEKEKI